MIKVLLNVTTKERAWTHAFFEGVCVAAEPYLKIPSRHTAEISVILIGSAAMRALNRKRRGRAEATDVLSFPLFQKPIPGCATILLGDVFICPAVVRERAASGGLTLRRQMAWTIIHGLLHCAGYDHEQGVRAAKRMAALEEKILSHITT